MANPLEEPGAGKNGRGDGKPVRSELLREVNDRIREVSLDAAGAVDTFEFVCECGGGDCVAMVELTARQYEGIRLRSGLVLAAGHGPP